MRPLALFRVSANFFRWNFLLPERLSEITLCCAFKKAGERPLISRSLSCSLTIWSVTRSPVGRVRFGIFFLIFSVPMVECNKFFFSFFLDCAFVQKAKASPHPARLWDALSNVHEQYLLYYYTQAQEWPRTCVVEKVLQLYANTPKLSRDFWVGTVHAKDKEIAYVPPRSHHSWLPALLSSHLCLLAPNSRPLYSQQAHFSHTWAWAIDVSKICTALFGWLQYAPLYHEQSDG